MKLIMNLSKKIHTDCKIMDTNLQPYEKIIKKKATKNSKKSFLQWVDNK